MFSIVLPLYNKEKDISKTINSILSQSFAEFELIIIDDGSTDKSVKKVLQIKDERITLFQKSNKGVSAARNYGIKRAKHQYVCLIDGDDIWLENYLERFNEEILNLSSPEILSCAYARIRKGEIENVNLGIEESFNSGYIHNFFELARITKDTLITSSSVVIKKSVLNEIGLFNESLKYGEDLDLWFRILSRYSLYFINDIMLHYNFDGHDRASNKTFNAENDIVFHLNQFREFEEKDVEFKRFLDSFRLQKLKIYYLEQKYLKKVNAELKKIDPSNLSLAWKLFYRGPRIIIKPIYEVFFFLKHKYILPLKAKLN